MDLINTGGGSECRGGFWIGWKADVIGDREKKGRRPKTHSSPWVIVTLSLSLVPVWQCLSQGFLCYKYFFLSSFFKKVVFSLIQNNILSNNGVPQWRVGVGIDMDRNGSGQVSPPTQALLNEGFIWKYASAPTWPITFTVLLSISAPQNFIVDEQKGENL